MNTPSLRPVPLAATVVLLRDGGDGLSVLMVRRRKELAFCGGAWVFPGGRVDAKDYVSDGDDDAAARRAAVREVMEETGLELEPATLAHFAQWITPAGLPRRFDTYFFASPLPAGEVRIDEGELCDYRHFRPQDALRARARGEIVLPPPTFVTLTTLARAQSATEGLALLSEPAEVIVPRPVATDTGAVYLYPRDAGYEQLDPERSGPRHRLTVTGADYAFENSE